MTDDNSNVWDPTVVDEFNIYDENDFSEEPRCLLRSRTLNELMSSHAFSSLITTPVDKTPGEVLLMALQFSIHAQLPFKQLSSIISLINNIFMSPILPETTYMLNNILNPQNIVQYHVICPTCNTYLGEFRDSLSVSKCIECEREIALNGPSSANIFVLINPSEAVKTLVEDNSDYYEHVIRTRRPDGNIRDVYDGECYRSCVEQLPDGEKHRYVTAILNTDGAPRFKNSKTSIWPIYLQLNELPPDVRSTNLITSGMWIGKDKPQMIAFLEPFVTTMNRITEDGIECTINGQIRSLKLFIVMSCVDSVARAPMQGIKQFNGKYGCNWCLHLGQWIEGSYRYVIPESGIRPVQRTMDSMLSWMDLTESDNCPREGVYGLQYASPLINMHKFDIVDSFVPDYMHCCLAGVAQQITEYLIQTLSTEQRYLVNEILRSIIVPCYLARLTRGIDQRNDWKAKEWENFVLYYSFPVFNTVLEKKLLKYWTLFSESLYQLLKTNITIHELNEIDAALNEFVFDTQVLFTKVAMTYNIHQLLHLCSSVMNWGPLWAHSTFSFESANRYMLQAIHCAKGANLQIVRYVNIQHSIRLIKDRIYNDVPFAVGEYCDNIPKRKCHSSFKVGHVTYVGKEIILPNDVTRQLNLNAHSTVAYQRAIIRKCLYTSANIQNQRTDNSFARLKNDAFIQILYFAVDNVTRNEVTLCKIIQTSPSHCKHILLVEYISNEITQINTNEINSICVFMSVLEKQYICAPPNLYHY